MSTDEHPDSGLPLHAEIANTEFRLTALREQRETFLRQGRMMKRVTWIAVGLAPLPIIYAAVNAEPDLIPMVFIGSLLIAVAAVLL